MWKKNITRLFGNKMLFEHFFKRFSIIIFFYQNHHQHYTDKCHVLVFVQHIAFTHRSSAQLTKLIKRPLKKSTIKTVHLARLLLGYFSHSNQFN